MNVIEISDVTKKYSETTVVHSVSFSVKKGEIYGLLGRNGAGKTTIMKMLLGLVKPTEGQVHILGNDTNTGEGKAILRKVGCIIENPGFYANLTGTENLHIFARLKALDDETVQKALALVNLPYNDKKLFSKYSLGMKQRLAIANAVMHDPEVLILDEPINGLDPIGIAEVRKLLIDLKQSGVSILISSHILSEIESLADRIGIINDGKLIDEIHIAEWQNKTEGIKIFVRDTEQVRKVLLKEGVKESDIICLADGITVKSDDISVAQLNTIFVGNGIEVSGIMKERMTLEDYFKKATGGQGIG